MYQSVYFDKLDKVQQVKYNAKMEAIRERVKEDQEEQKRLAAALAKDKAIQRSQKGKSKKYQYLG